MSDCLNCSEYNKEKHFCPKWCDVIKSTIEDARADERRKFAEWISQYLGEGNTNNVLYTYRQSPVGFIWQTTKSVDEIISEYEKKGGAK